MGWDGMGWDGRGWDGMGWDGDGDGMGWGGDGREAACRCLVGVAIDFGGEEGDEEAGVPEMR
jgi:hypothetical protein